MLIRDGLYLGITDRLELSFSAAFMQTANWE